MLGGGGIWFINLICVDTSIDNCMNKSCDTWQQKSKSSNFLRVSDMEGMVIWQNARQAFAKAAVLRLCFPFINLFAFTARLHTHRMSLSLISSRLQNIERHSTYEFNCCSRSLPKSIFSMNPLRSIATCFFSPAGDRESIESWRMRPISNTVLIREASLIFQLDLNWIKISLLISNLRPPLKTSSIYITKLI